MGLSKLWGKDSSGNRGFVFSHIKTIYYNWAQKKLLSTKLDEMDSATNGKIDKTSIVQVESTSQTNVPSSAYLKTVKDALDGDISELNAKIVNPGILDDFNALPSINVYYGNFLHNTTLNCPPDTTADGSFLKVGQLLLAKDWQGNTYSRLYWGTAWGDWSKI